MMEENICLPHRLTHIYLSVDRLKAICPTKRNGGQARMGQ